MTKKIFEFEKTTYPFTHFILGSGDGEERAGCSLSMGLGKSLLKVKLPQIIKPKSTKIYPKWDEKTVARLGRDYYFKYNRKNYGFTLTDNHVHLMFGVQSDDSDVKSSDFSFFIPWAEFTYKGITFYHINGAYYQWIPDSKNDYELVSDAKNTVSKAAFILRDFDGELVMAICHIQERQWHRGIKQFKWLRHVTPVKKSKVLDIHFSEDVGTRKNDWKGGTVGDSIELLENELPINAINRYCSKHGMTFISDVTTKIDGDPIVLTDPRLAYFYAEYIIKGRWLPGELVIMLSEYASDYAKLCEN